MESAVPNAMPRGVAALIQESRVAEERGDWAGSRAYLQQALAAPDARQVEGLACVLLRLIARSFRREGDLDAAADACEAAIAAAERHPAALALTQALAERETIDLQADGRGDAADPGADSTGVDAAGVALPRPGRPGREVRRSFVRLLDPDQLSLLDLREGPTPIPTPGRGFEAITADAVVPLDVEVIEGEGAPLIPFASRLAARGIALRSSVVPPWKRALGGSGDAGARTPDAVVLDGRSPRLISDLGELRMRCPQAALVVLGGASLLAGTLQYLELGAQEVLPTPATPEQLERAIRLAVARQRRETGLRALALLDPLTGLYNRRGFLTLVRQQEELALRLNRRMLHVFVDLDGLKRINDTFGHHEGDVALQDVAAVLRRTFRESDVIARIGGDEFAVLAVEMDERWSSSWEARLQEQLAGANRDRDRGYELVLSVGVAAIAPGGTGAQLRLEERLGLADVDMYRIKREHYLEEPILPLPPPITETPPLE